MSKDTGGLSGKTENVGAISWMRINHIIAALRENIDEVTQNRQTSTHADLWKKRRRKSDEKYMQTMVTCLEN